MFAPPPIATHPAAQPVPHSATQPPAQPATQPATQPEAQLNAPAAQGREQQQQREQQEHLLATIAQQAEQIALLTDKLGKTELDLEALSQAYTALDDHAAKLQRQLEDANRNAQPIPSPALDDEAIEDLLVCLGQEEEKNKALQAEIDRLKLNPSVV